MSTETYQTRAVAFICWLDILERIDTLILEIRHVQETIVSQLHAADFYEIFQYEDNYLWGRYCGKILDRNEQARSKDWFEILNSHQWSSFPHFCTVLAAVWCPEFPPTSGKSVFYQTLSERGEVASYEAWFDRDRHDAGIGTWKTTRAEISTKNLFSANDDRLYEALRYLQLLKRDILRDKVVLAYRALEAFDAFDRPFVQTPLAHFLLVRRGALYSLHRRLDGFRDILTTVQEILNLSMERDPPPTVWRRRDQGVYTTDLADNCHYIERNIRNYFKGIGVITDNRPPHLLGEVEIEFIVHRYTRNYTSTARYDSIWNRSGVGEQLSNVGAGFVQSSFWMPERPDLQPIIVHEIAHLLVISHYGNLRPVELDSANDFLGELLREISCVLETNLVKFERFELFPRTREDLLREIACDLIGVAVHGTSYLLAHFLEIFCIGCERLFHATPSGDIAQNIFQLGDEYITYISDDPPQWLLRLPIALAFWNAIRGYGPRRAAYLESVIYDGVKGLIDGAHGQLSSWMDGDQRKDWLNWFKMVVDLIKLVERSELVKVTAKWLQARSEMGELGTNQTTTDDAHDRYLRSLSHEIKARCLGAWLDRLVEPPRMLGTYLNEEWPIPDEITYSRVIEAFRKLYLKHQLDEFKNGTELESSLFNHLIDIPWQTAILTVHDLLGTPPLELYGVPKREWITALHEFNWLGRDLYHWALEFVIWHERPSIGRLKAMNRWLISIRNMMKTLEHKSVEPLKALLSSILGEDVPEPSRKSALAERLRNLRELLRPLFEQWREKPDLLGEALVVGSQAICRFYPGHEPETVEGSGDEREKWMHFFDSIATAQMGRAHRSISKALSDFFSAEENVALVAELAHAVNRPIRNAKGEQHKKGSADETFYLHCGRVIIELIRVFQYLGIRPETDPDGLSTGHHANGRKLKWNGVFAQYLDVPIHPRKRESGAGSRAIDRLVPVRSLRIDRFSQVYVPHLSSEAIVKGRDGTRYPGHLPADTVLVGAPLFGIPWGSDGVRREPGEHGFSSTHLETPLLGRFDRLMLDAAKHTARFGHNPGVEDVILSPFFRRQQIGLPFSARVDERAGRVHRAELHHTLPTALETLQSGMKPSKEIVEVPLATISILLVQRSARLTFVERMVSEDLVMKSLSSQLSSPYRYFRPDKDIGLLTDGWGDIFLVLFAKFGWKQAEKDSKGFDAYVDKCETLKERVDDIITLRKSIFEDTLVVRSETSYTPLAVDVALLNPNDFRCTMSIRFKTSLDARSLSDEFEGHMYDALERKIVIKHRKVERSAKLAELLLCARTAGRTDYMVTTKNDVEEGLAEAIYRALCGKCENYESYGIIFETLRRIFFKPKVIEDHVDSTITSIAELGFPKH